MYIESIKHDIEVSKLQLLLQLIWYKGLFLNEKPKKTINMEGRKT
jgi:hypothetical protein